MESFIKSKDKNIVLVSNIGSASRKYIVFSINKKNKEIKEEFEIQFDQKEFYPEIELNEALYSFFEIAKKKYNFSISDIDIILERVVATGEFFLKNRLINEEYLEKLNQAKKYDTIHTKSLINEINQIFLIREVCKNKKIKIKFKIIGISDSSFHSTIQKETYTYGLKINKENNFRKYGYHGISMSEVSRSLKMKYENIIAIHLGGGGSVTAIKNGKSIYNSFGMTPISGLINLTRCGDIDPLIVLDILKNHKKPFRFLNNEDYLFNDTKNYLYKESGLFALTDEKDMRDILKNLYSKNKNIREKNNFAIKVYLDKINESIGVSLSHLGKVDALILTGAILENSEIFRNMLLEKTSWLSLLDKDILILQTKEEKEMLNIAIEEKLI